MSSTESTTWDVVKTKNKSGIKQLRGNRVYLEMPPQTKETKLEVDNNTKEALQRELILKMSKLNVHTVGDTITDIYPGDVVMVDPEGLNKAKIIPLSENENVILVSSFDIIHIWI